MNPACEIPLEKLTNSYLQILFKLNAIQCFNQELDETDKNKLENLKHDLQGIDELIVELDSQVWDQSLPFNIAMLSSYHQNLLSRAIENNELNCLHELKYHLKELVSACLKQ